MLAACTDLESLVGDDVSEARVLCDFVLLLGQTPPLSLAAIAICVGFVSHALR